MVWSNETSDEEYVGRKVLQMQLTGKLRHRTKEEVSGCKRRYLDVVKEDMQEVGAREDEVFGCGEGGHAGGRSERRLSVWMW